MKTILIATLFFITTIALAQTPEQLHMQLIDVTVKIVIKQNCTTNYNNCFINLLPNAKGMYILKISNKANATIIKKVVLE
jgi:Secretion system C-terminal sorting domain